MSNKIDGIAGGFYLFDIGTVKQYCSETDYQFIQVTQMIETTANEFRKMLKSKVDACINNHEVLKVNRRNGENFVVLGEEDWRAVEETLYLNQFPGLVGSIQKATSEPLSEGTAMEDIDW